jgi:prolipoprotein diacylglyceryltransferase
MTFPVHFDLLGRSIPAHPVFEVLAYTGGFQLYLLRRRRYTSQQAVSFDQIMWILVGCVLGALIGSKLLAWAESPADYARAAAENPLALLGGKTIVGGLLGGWIGVEIVKKILGVTTSTGDAFVFPLILGMSIGRIGCFLTGLPDHTHGVHTNLPWAVDFGDGPRHPTQLYEIAFLLMLGLWLALRARRPHRNGQLFRLFMLGYLLFRFFIEFIKPSEKPWLGLSAIQCACAIGAAVCAVSLSRRRPHERASAAELQHA